MLASDLNNPEFANPQNPDSLLNVSFYTKALSNDWKTQQEGRPMFDEVVMVRIIPPGDALNIIDTVAGDHHKKRFPRHWEMYERMHGTGNLQSGTPLEQWPMLGVATVAQLKAMMFTTVESIAGSPDEKLIRMGMAGGMSPYALRDQAKRFLAVAHDASVVNHAEEEAKKLRDEMQAQAQQHAEQLAAMQAQMQGLMAAIQQPQPAERVKRKYTKKAVTQE